MESTESDEIAMASFTLQKYHFLIIIGGSVTTSLAIWIYFGSYLPIVIAFAGMYAVKLLLEGSSQAFESNKKSQLQETQRLIIERSQEAMNLGLAELTDVFKQDQMNEKQAALRICELQRQAAMTGINKHKQIQTFRHDHQIKLVANDNNSKLSSVRERCELNLNQVKTKSNETLAALKKRSALELESTKNLLQEKLETERRKVQNAKVTSEAQIRRAI